MKQRDWCRNDTEDFCCRFNTKNLKRASLSFIFLSLGYLFFCFQHWGKASVDNYVLLGCHDCVSTENTCSCVWSCAVSRLEPPPDTPSPSPSYTSGRSNRVLFEVHRSRFAWDSVQDVTGHTQRAALLSLRRRAWICWEAGD